MTAETELIISELTKRFDSKIDQLGSGINGRFTNFDGKLTDLDGRFTNLDEKFTNLNNKFDSFSILVIERFEQVDTAFADLASAMQYGFEKVSERFDEVDERFDRLEGRTDKVEEGLEYLKVEVRDVKARAIHLESSMEEVQESLANLEYAEEKDAKATINHETRIQKLERLNKIKPKPVAHLLNI